MPTPLGTANRFGAPYQAVKAKDAYFVMGANNNKLFASFCDVVGRPELASDPRFAANTGRLSNRIALIAEMEMSLASKTAEEWIDLLLDAGVPAGPINDFSQSLSAEHTRARDAVMEIEHPVEGKVKSIGFPVKLSESKQRVRLPPPLLGQHTDEILKELGIDEAKRKSLHDEGAT